MLHRQPCPLSEPLSAPKVLLHESEHVGVKDTGERRL